VNDITLHLSTSTDSRFGGDVGLLRKSKNHLERARALLDFTEPMRAV